MTVTVGRIEVEVEEEHLFITEHDKYGYAHMVCLDADSLPSLRAALDTPLTAREIEEAEARAERKTGDMAEVPDR